MFDAVARRPDQGALDSQHQSGRQHAARRAGARGAWRLPVCRRQRLLGDRYDGLCRCRLAGGGWGEKDGTVTNSERCISRQRAFRPPPGEARPDWWMLAEVARRMGWQTEFAYREPGRDFPRTCRLVRLRERRAEAPDFRYRGAFGFERRRLRPAAADPLAVAAQRPGRTARCETAVWRRQRISPLRTAAHASCPRCIGLRPSRPTISGRSFSTPDACAISGTP